MELRVRAPLYVKPRARARTRVGKSSLPLMPEPEKNPVPKNATGVPSSNSVLGSEACAYSGTKQAASRVYKTNELRRPNLSARSEEHTSELQSRFDLVCRL